MKDVYDSCYQRKIHDAISEFINVFFEQEEILDEFFTERQKEVLKLILIERKTPTEIAQQLNLSRERIRQIIEASLLGFRNRFPRHISYLNNRIDSLEESLEKMRNMPLPNSIKKKKVAYKGKNVLYAPIMDFGFSERALNIMKGEKIEMVGELIRYSSTDLRRLRGMGEGTLNEIKDILSKVELELSD